MPDDVFEKHDLPSGGWVAFRDPKLLTRGQRKPLDRARNRVGMAQNLGAVLRGEMSPGDLADSEVDLLEGLMESVVVVLTDEWSFDAPVTAEALNDLMQEDYDAIVEHAAPHRPALIPDFSPTDEKTDAAGSENPTGRSPASKPPSAANRRAARSQTPSEPGGS